MRTIPVCRRTVNNFYRFRHRRCRKINFHRLSPLCLSPAFHLCAGERKECTKNQNAANPTSVWHRIADKLRRTSPRTCEQIPSYKKPSENTLMSQKSILSVIAPSIGLSILLATFGTSSALALPKAAEHADAPVTYATDVPRPRAHAEKRVQAKHAATSANSAKAKKPKHGVTNQAKAKPKSRKPPQPRQSRTPRK